MSDDPGLSSSPQGQSPERDRRDFLVKAGRFAVVTPPAISMLLVTSMNSNAVAGSGGGGGSNKVKGNNGWGNGGNDGTNPGSSHGKTAGSKSANILR